MQSDYLEATKRKSAFRLHMFLRIVCVCICVCRIGWNNIALPCNMQIMGMNYYLESNLSRPPSGRYALAYARSCAGSGEENT